MITKNRTPLICNSSQQAFKLVKPYISDLAEDFWVITLGPSHHVLGLKKLFIGTVDSCFFHPRDLFRAILEKNASGFIVAHNHPSNCLTPSEEDIQVTLQIQKASYLIGVHFIDHIILCRKNFLSLASSGYLDQKTKEPI